MMTVKPSLRCIPFLFAAVLLATLATARADDAAIGALIKSLQLVSYRAGTKPPPFDGTTPSGRHIVLAELRGKVVVLNFWASWCAECRPEMPALESLHRNFASRGLVMLGVNAREDPPAIQRFVKELRLSFPVVTDADGRINSLYGVVGVPATFIIARDGRAVAFGVGPRDWSGAPARALLEALLKETESAPPP
jgi:peroxiredoxin